MFPGLASVQFFDCFFTVGKSETDRNCKIRNTPVQVGKTWEHARLKNTAVLPVAKDTCER